MIRLSSWRGLRVVFPVHFLSLVAWRDSLVQTGRTYLADLVKNYTSKYEYSVQFVERNPADDLFLFRVTFSSPTPEKPVPEAEAHVHFQLKGWFLKNLRTSQLTGRDLQDVEAAVGKSPLIAEKPDKEPPIVFWFESQNLKHTPERTLAPGKFQRWIDRIVQDKLRLRRQNTMRTAFEISRMNVDGAPIAQLLHEQKIACILDEKSAEYEAQSNARREALTAAATEAARQKEREARQSGRAILTPRMLFEVPQEDLPLEQVLEKVFHAADEDKEGKLSHKDVADLLLASPLGLQRWDLLLLLAAAAHEDRQGYIRYQDFVQQAPGVIRTLRERRKVSANTNQCHVTDEAVQLCYRDELEDSWRIMRDIFEAADPSAATTGHSKLPRGLLLDCLRSRPERFSSMEVTLLMQLAPTGDNGCVAFHSFPSMLRILRRESINNAVLETDKNALREEILLALHKLFDCSAFMARAENIAKEAADAAARAEIEELQGLTGGKSRRKQSTKENETYKVDGLDDSEQVDAPDKETVEKTLIHLFTVIDDKRRGVIPVQAFISAVRFWAAGASGNAPVTSRYSPAQQLSATGTRPDSPSPAVVAGPGGSSLGLRPASAVEPNGKAFGPGGPSTFGLQGGSPGSAAAAAERRYADVVASCRLSVEEITGFLAEVEVDEHHQEVAYQEHIKTWVPIVFEMRKSPVYFQLIHTQVDSAASADRDGTPPDLDADAEALEEESSHAKK